MFFRGSRYEPVADAVHVDPRGREIVYKRLRLLPNPAVHQEHVVALEDRLDRIAHRYYSDPEQFWRIGDANHAIRPESLVKDVGRRLGIPLV
jgi:hypothetical protein